MSFREQEDSTWGALGERPSSFIPEWKKGGRRKWPPNNEALWEWLLGGVKRPHFSRENIFKLGAPMASAYEGFVREGGIKRMEEEKYGQDCLARLRRVVPSDRYFEGIDYSDLSPVIQKGKGNRGWFFDKYWEESKGFKTAGIYFLIQKEDGWGEMTEMVSFEVWFAEKRGTIVALQLTVDLSGVRTGDILGGPGSMSSPISSRETVLRVHHDYMPEGYHLSFISGSRWAAMVRKLSDVFGR